MTRIAGWLRRRLLLMVAGLSGAAPFAFGTIRAITTGNDFRYLWVAAAALVGSMMAAPPTRATSGSILLALRRASGAAAAGAACASVVGMLLGTRLGPGLAIVAAAFGLCTGASVVLMGLVLQPDVGGQPS